MRYQRRNTIMMKKAILILLLLGAAQFSLLAQTHEEDNGHEEALTGIASYYADKFHGRQTANGSIYDKTKLTAACNRLPLNTWIKVTNLRNKKSVVVKITDRMHPKNKRLVDMSRAAAKKLGFIKAGLTKVRVEVLEDYSPDEP